MRVELESEMPVKAWVYRNIGFERKYAKLIFTVWDKVIAKVFLEKVGDANFKTDFYCFRKIKVYSAYSAE